MIHAMSSRMPSRRTFMVLALVLAALVVALSLVEPPSSSRGTDPGTGDDTGSGGGSVAFVDGKEDGVASGPLGVIGEEKPAAQEAGRSADGDVKVTADSIGGFAGEMEDVAAAPTSSTTSSSPPTVDIKVIRTGSLGLEVGRGTFDEAFTEAQHTATALGGYVVTASRSGAGKSARFGTLTIRIPGARFDDAMDSLRGIKGAKVERLEVSSQDVTQEYVDTASRLRHDRAVESRLLALVAKADDVSEVLAVQAQLDQVQEQIEISKGRLTYLDRMTEMTTIEIAIREPGARAKASEKQADEGEPWGVRASLEDSAHRFVGNINRFVVWLGGALPLLLALGVVGMVARSRWNRRSSAS